MPAVRPWVARILGLVAATFFGVGVSLADPKSPAPLDASLNLKDGKTVTAAFSVAPAFTGEFKKRLSAGIQSRVLVIFELVDSDDRSIAARTRECDMVLDVWEGALFVEVREFDRRRALRLAKIEDGLKACGEVQGATVTERSKLQPGQRYFMKVQVILNPVSQELIEKTREFLANPRGGRPGSSRTFFGAVARFFSSDEEAIGMQELSFLAGPLTRPVETEGGGHTR